MRRRLQVTVLPFVCVETERERLSHVLKVCSEDQENRSVITIPAPSNGLHGQDEPHSKRGYRCRSERLHQVIPEPADCRSKLPIFNRTSHLLQLQLSFCASPACDHPVLLNTVGPGMRLSETSSRHHL
ncbi:hypothetical protein VZT92_027821 [Zoarces viviparus]|uniref:Uncharacterized protein n=1 Tax=Zoarces viviparus TaxID=48416 RepID=A0AAW1DVV1_ZOAVI